MLMERILGALTFNRQVYADVEQDSSFTNTAWAIVAGTAVLVQLPNLFREGSILGVVAGALFTTAGFAFATFVVSWVGRTLFQADVTFHEMVRTLGLAYVWQAAGIIPLIGWLSFFAVIAAWYVAAKEALDLDTGQTILTVVIGGAVILLINAIAVGILAGIGFTIAAFAGGLGG